MSIEITAIDIRVEKLSLSAFAGVMAFIQRTGVSNAFTGNTKTMVDNVIGPLTVLQKLKSGSKISRLNVLDHGDSSKIEIGFHNSIYRLNTGENVRANLGGSFDRNVDRP